MNQEDKDYEEFKQNVELKEVHEMMVEKYKKKTQAYLYKFEAERVMNRKTDSERYHRELDSKQNQV